jgi:hypothetical protein
MPALGRSRVVFEVRVAPFTASPTGPFIRETGAAQNGTFVRMIVAYRS